MAEIVTARVHEMLGIQIAVVQDLARRLETGDLERLEGFTSSLEKEVASLRSMLAGLPHKHQ